MMKGNNFSSPVPMIKLEKFTATEFNDWKLNTQFGMKYLNVFYTVQSDRVSAMGTEEEAQWIADEDFCRDYLLNCLSSSLAKTYIKMNTAKEIWEALEEHFRQEEDLSKAHLVDKFHSFMFDEEKAILPQYLIEDEVEEVSAPCSGVVDGCDNAMIWWSLLQKYLEQKLLIEKLP